MQEDLEFHIKAFTRLIYFVTEEEDRFLLQLHEAMHEKVVHAKVFNAAFGLIPLTELISDWTSKQHPVKQDTINIHDALIAIYKEQPLNDRKFYVITDPERHLNDVHAQRRILNIVHQVRNDVNTVKVIIFVGNKRFVPDKLSRYMEVIQDNGLTPDEIEAIVQTTASGLHVEPPEDTQSLFKGLTSFEVQSALIQSYKRTRSLQDSKRLATYRYKQLRKTDLVQHIDTSQYTFDEVGGVDRFKKWAHRAKAAWSAEGRDFGLEPPKGLLAVGVHGTGKSLSVKALGNTWGLPVVQLEMGRLRSSAVGESEANVYRATKLIDALAPCVVWVDEAEKSLSGGQSSAHTDAGTTSRTIGILSTWLQETTAPVCLALTANSLKTLPIEFINRMDERWFFDMPSLEDRMEILKIHLIKRKQDPAKFNLVLLAEKATDMVGREIEQSLKAAMAESFAQRREGLDQTLFVEELVRKPRLIRTMADEIQETLEWVGYDKTVDDGIRARFAADPKGQDRSFTVV